MTTISERILVESPPSIALRSIERYLKSNDDVLTLTVPLKTLGLPTELEISRRVKVTFKASHRNRLMIGRSDEGLALEWSPEGGGPYPTFKAIMVVRPCSGQTEIELEGQYEPPVGIVGGVFDAIAGNKIAQATAQALLARLKTALERDFATFKEGVERPTMMHG